MAYTSPVVTASSTTFAQFQSGGLSAMVEKFIAAHAGTASPTAAPTAAATGGGASGGLLAAGTYYLVFTETNGYGETLKSPESSLLTVSATNIPRVTFPALKAGNAARRLYCGAVNGATGGPYFLYATGITTTTYDMATAVVADSRGATNPPVTAQTGFGAFVDANGNTMRIALNLLRGAERGDLQKAYNYLHDVTTAFNSGEPQRWNALEMKLRHAHVTFAILAALCAEVGTLIDNNPGSLSTAETPIGGRKTRRTWP